VRFLQLDEELAGTETMAEVMARTVPKGRQPHFRPVALTNLEGQRDNKPVPTKYVSANTVFCICGKPGRRSRTERISFGEFLFMGCSDIYFTEGIWKGMRFHGSPSLVRRLPKEHEAELCVWGPEVRLKLQKLLSPTPIFHHLPARRHRS
jgi:hypothetical protein